ncbi:UDP-N-acetylmuramate dehydrogenase [Candidatus Bipolaricaulota bacterium]|nr:UDP-N-acetylmuramate dehydrogenase [Candidatus Bipolaricaulota bacterium]
MVSPIAEKLDYKLIQQDVSLKKMTTWHVGGPARFFCRPNSLDEIRKAVSFARKHDLDYRIVGNGSNILVPDEGYEGLIIQLGNGFGEIDVTGQTVRAEAGASLSKLATTANEAGSQCLNFLTGIPGTLGGGVAMNAGAHGREISDYLKDLSYMDEKGEIRKVSDLSEAFGYRESPFRSPGKIVLSAEFELDYDETQPEMSQLLRSRKNKIPYDEYTAGSVFKNPSNHEKTAGELLDEAGNKGLNVGDAVVSHQHANFILNKGHATAKNIQNIIDISRNRVYKEFGVTLVTEVVVI